MIGVEKIIDRIISDSKEKAALIVSDAQKKAEESNQIYLDNINKKAQAILQKAQAEAEVIKNRSERAAIMEARNFLIVAKQSAIDEVVLSAVEYLKNLDDESYTGVVSALLVKAAGYRGGEIVFPSKRVGLNEAIVQKALADGAKNICVLASSDVFDSGFLLKQKDIEINCTFKALEKYNREAVRQSAHQALFGVEG